MSPVELHRDCVLAIVGSLNVPRYNSESLIREAFVTHKPKLVVSGGAKGVDTHAREIAIEVGIPFVEITSTRPQWDAPDEIGDPIETVTEYGMSIVIPGGFKQRNMKVAEMCDCLERIFSRTTRTYGSGWTADQAERLGKNVVRHAVD